MASVADMLRAVLPPRAKDLLRSGIRAWGTGTSFARSLPSIVIIGAMRGGTTALYSYLLEHPGIAGPHRKEVDFFDVNFPRGTAWYRGHFPTLAQCAYLRLRHRLDLVLAAEASPSYLFHPHAGVRLASLLPEAKVIVLLRDPVRRALSHYHHQVAAGRERLSFEDALKQEPERLDGERERMERDPSYFSHPWFHFSYLARGLYADQLRRWFDVVPRERVMVAVSEQFFADPAATFRAVLEFVGAEPYSLSAYPPVLSREYPDMRPETRCWLTDYFRAPNEALAELIGRGSRLGLKAPGSAYADVRRPSSPSAASAAT